MIRFSKKIEYALLALQYMSGDVEKTFSAKEISDKLNISYEFLSKTLQSLMKKGLVKSIKGVNGGYILSKSPNQTSINEIIKALDESQFIASCFDDSYETCSRVEICSIKKPLEKIQKKIEDVFKNITLDELLNDNISNQIINFNTNINGDLWQKN